VSSRREHLADFKERGVENVRLQILHANFSPEKHKDAEKWVYREDHRYQRRADTKSTIAIVVSLAAFILHP
jgi:hypothetical protein